MSNTSPVDSMSASPLPYSCAKENSGACNAESSWTAIAYLNGHRIFFDTRYPYVNPNDWWRPKSTQHEEREWVASRTRATLYPSVGMQRDCIPPLSHTGEGNRFHTALNSVGCTSSISIHPDSERNACDGSCFSHQREEKSEKTMVEVQEEKEKNLPSIQRKPEDERVRSLGWGTPLFLVDYTTLWMREAARRLRARKCDSLSAPSVDGPVKVEPFPPSRTAHAGPASSPIEHSRLYCSHTTSSFTVEEKEENDRAMVAADPLCRAASSSVSGRSSVDPSQFSLTHARGNVHCTRSDEEEDEWQAFTALEVAVQQGIAALPPFPVMLMLPTTVVCEGDETPSPSSPSGDEMASHAQQEARHVASIHCPRHAYAGAPDAAMPERSEDNEIDLCKETPSYLSSGLSTRRRVRSTMAVSGGGSAATESETGRRITAVDAKMTLQPYHHYHTVAFCPEPLALVAGEWNAAQCIQELWRSQCSVGSTPYSPVELTSPRENGEKKCLPPFMYKRRSKGSVLRADRRTFLSRSEKKMTVEEGSGGDRWSPTDSRVASFPCWVYEELKGFSTFQKRCDSSAFRALKKRSSKAVGKGKEGIDGNNGIECDDSGPAAGITHASPSLHPDASLSGALLAHTYWTLPVEDRAFLQTFSRLRSMPSPSSRSSSCTPLSAAVRHVSSDEDRVANGHVDHMAAPQESRMDSSLSFPVLVPSSNGTGRIEGQKGEKRKRRGSRDTSLESTTAEPPTGKRQVQEDAVFRPRRILLKKETKELLQKLRKGRERSL